MGMVKAAYSSGKPALGVGAGNVQCIIDRDADMKDAVPKIIMGRTFDNGIICSGEQSVVVPAEKYDEIIREFAVNGAYHVSAGAERERLRDALFVCGAMNTGLIGQSVEKIAETAEIEIPQNTKVIIVDAADPDDIFGQGKDVSCIIRL